MRVPYFAAFHLSLLSVSTVHGARDEAEVGKKEMERNGAGLQEEMGHGALTSDPNTSDPNTFDPNTLVENTWSGLATESLQIRDQKRFDNDNELYRSMWALQYVNPKWSYNRDLWKSYELDWGKVTDAMSWRTEIKKDRTTDMSKWNDKIWLSRWFQTNNLAGPDIVWSKYSDSPWHSQQPLRWHGEVWNNNQEAEGKYIDGEYTGIDWKGIADLNDNFVSKLNKLDETPSDLMKNLLTYCVTGAGSGSEPGSFVIKASHLSESQGVFVVKDGKLVIPVRFDFIQNIKYPVKKGGGKWLNDEEMKNENVEKEQNIFDAFPNLKREMDKVTGKGTDVCKDLARAQLVMQFQEMIWVRWESARSKIIPRGTVVELLRSKDLEIKISVGLGRAWGFYYNSIDFDKLASGEWTRLTKPARKTAYDLAERAAVAAGVDFCRVDIIIGAKGLIISELTLVPGLNDATKQPLNQHIQKLTDWHKYYKAANEAPELVRLFSP